MNESEYFIWWVERNGFGNVKVRTADCGCAWIAETGEQVATCKEHLIKSVQSC